MDYLPYAMDGIVILAIGVMMYIGFSKGFLFATFSFLPMLCAFVGVKLFTSTVATFLKNTVVYEKVVAGIVEKIAIDEGFSSRWMEPDLFSYLEMPEFLEEILAKTHLEHIDTLFDLEGATQFFAESIADVCVFIFSAILVFFVILIAGKIILRLLDVMASLPVLRFLNKTLGAALGGIQGVFWIWIVGIILALQECSGSFTEVFVAMDQTKIANLLYENNILLQMVLQVFG